MSAPHAHLAGWAAIRVFGAFALAYFMSFALRSIGAVIAPELTRDFGLSNAALGSMSSAYFLAFALMQLPLGIWLDRFGARRTHATLLVFAAAGCAVFALAREVLALWIGRALIGVGVAGALMSAMKAFRFWYAPDRQQQMAAWMLTAGSLGALATTVPVQASLPVIGWRGVFWVAAGLLALASLGVYVLLPRDEEQSSHAQLDGGSLWAGYAEVFADAYFWRFAMLSVLSHAGFVALQTLWAGPWLVQVLGLTPERAAQALFVINLVLMTAFLALGSVAPRMQRAGWSMVRIAAGTTCVVLAAQTAIALATSPASWMLWIVLALCATTFTMLQPHVSLTFPPALTGRAYTAYNLLVFGGMFVWQWLFGVGVDALRAAGFENATAFRGTLGLAVIVQAVGLVAFLLMRAQPR